MIPERFLRKCELCGHDLDTSKEGVHQWTSGWVRQRSGGGGHGISLAKREDRWAHHYCVERIASGYAGQNELF